MAIPVLCFPLALIVWIENVGKFFGVPIYFLPIFFFTQIIINVSRNPNSWDVGLCSSPVIEISVLYLSELQESISYCLFKDYAIGSAFVNDIHIKINSRITSVKVSNKQP